METEHAYFERKYRELELIAHCLDRPSRGEIRPRTIEGVIETKFRLAAALKAEYAARAWGNTETAWRGAPRLSLGPFEFGYRYQRADLAVAGPSPYGALESRAGIRVQQLTYTCSGMAAISAVLLAIAGRGQGTVCFPPGSYKETTELAASYVPGLRTAIVDSGRRHGARHRERCTLWLDRPASGALEAGATSPVQGIDLIVFDTTCFHAQSGRIGRVLNWARRARAPAILVRSHTKLDTLGVEYGRLGSAMLLRFPEVPLPKLRGLNEIGRKLRDLVRLLGSAALPAHFCPFVGSRSYRELSARRGAAMLRNGHLLERALRRELPSSSVRACPHGLFLGLVPPQARDEAEIAAEAGELCAFLRTQSLPIRHAGSFGFDFVASEAYFDTSLGRYVLRLTTADLPSEICLRLAAEIAAWWRRRWNLRQAA